MTFLIDAQLPRLLAIRLSELGQSAIHTLDLKSGNRTSDHEISALAERKGAVVITKNADFLNSHLLQGSPSRLLLISTGNIANRHLLGIFEEHLDQIVEALSESSLVEVTQAGITVHD